MKFSLIITGYNCEDFATECIISCYKQTYEDFEIIAVNDGSTDKTQEMLEQFNALEIIQNPINMGAAYSRWAALQQCTGDIVCFVGMDDVLTPNCLQVLSNYYANDYIKMTWGSWRYLDGGGKQAEHYPNIIHKENTYRKSKWRATALQTFKRELLEQVPLDVLKDEQGRWLTNCTDLAFGFPCLEMCQPHEMAAVKEFIYLYRHNHPNTTLNRLGVRHKTKIREYLKTIKPLKKHV